MPRARASGSPARVRAAPARRVRRACGVHRDLRPVQMGERAVHHVQHGTPGAVVEHRVGIDRGDRLGAFRQSFRRSRCRAARVDPAVEGAHEHRRHQSGDIVAESEERHPDSLGRRAASAATRRDGWARVNGSMVSYPADRGFDDSYLGVPPWDIGRPQREVEALDRCGPVRGAGTRCRVWHGRERARDGPAGRGGVGHRRLAAGDRQGDRQGTRARLGARRVPGGGRVRARGARAHRSTRRSTAACSTCSTTTNGRCTRRAWPAW